MTDMLHRYYTDYELAVLCQGCAEERHEAGERCEWAETPADWEQADLACADCGAVATRAAGPGHPDAVDAGRRRMRGGLSLWLLD